jgi:hypothetical protein
MRNHLGRASVAGAVLTWATLVVALVFGSRDASGTGVERLKASMLSALCIAAIALVAALVAVVRGPQRISATLGLVLALAFIVLFTGLRLPG